MKHKLITMKYLTKHSISTLLLLFCSIGLFAQLSVSKTVDQNNLFVSANFPETITFSIIVENTSNCDVAYYLTDDMRDSFSVGDLYGPQIIAATSTDGYFYINPDPSIPIITWSDTIPGGQIDTLTISTFFNFPWNNNYYNPFDYTNTAKVQYYMDCCTPILNDNDPDNDILCQCSTILADNDPLNDTLCNNICQDIFQDTIQENDYLCIATIGDGPYEIEAEATIFLEFCNEICDASFYHTFNECTGDFYAQTFQINPWVPYEWFVDGVSVGTSVPSFNYTLSPGTHEICGMTYDECMYYNCEWCVTLTVLDNSDCDAPFTYTLDPNTGAFSATSPSSEEWFVDGLQVGIGNTFTTILSPGIHDIIHFGSSACGVDCEYIETVTVNNNPCPDPCNAQYLSNFNECTGFLEALPLPTSTTTPYEWYVDGIWVDDNPIFTYTLSEGTHEVCLTTYDECLIASCESCQTLFAFPDCNASFTYTLDPNTGVFSATSNSNEEWFIDGIQVGIGNTFTTTLSAGVHDIIHYGTGTCGEDCEYIETVTVAGNDPCLNNQLLSTIISSSTMLTCNEPTIGFEVISTPPPSVPSDYTYEWSGNGGLGGNTASSGTTTSGTFEVTVTDGNGCTSTASIEIEENTAVPDVYIYAPTTDLPIGTSVTLEVIGTGNYLYDWVQLNSTTSTAIASQPGTYSVYVTDLDNGCATEVSITITQDGPCDDIDTCNPQFTYSYTYEANGAYNITVFPVDNFANAGYIEIDGIQQTAGQNNFILQPEATYSICYYTYGDLSCEFCAGCQTIIINTIPCSNPFSATITPSDTIATCYNPTVVLDVYSIPSPANPNDYTYEWSGSASGFTGSSVLLVPISPEVFTVTITDLQGCTTTANMFINTNNNIPDVSIFAPTTVLTNTVTSIDLEVIGTGNYTYNWGSNNTTSTFTVTEPGSYPVYVEDAVSGCGIDLEITITEELTDDCDYELGDLELNCGFSPNDVLCMPLLAKNNISNGIIGMDFCMAYNPGVMVPTGNAELGSVVLNGNPNASYAINTSISGMVCVTIYYTSDAPVGTNFVGSGEIACVEFAPLNTFTSGQTIGFGMENLIESYELDIVQGCADEGLAIISQNGTIMNANIRYWDDYALPLAYDVNNPANHLITNITGTDPNCVLLNTPEVTPDLFGSFQYDINNGTSIHLNRDINNGTQVMPTINGMDCYYAHLVTTLDASFTPSPYQIIAMDVNMNGSVTAGDITHMQNRITLNIGEYPQVWNDNTSDDSKDWLFVDDATLMQPNYTVSSGYPFNDGTGFYRLNVPQPTFCYEIPMTSNGVCSYPDSTNYHAILLGDTDKSWTTNTTSLRLGENTQVVLNIDEAIIIEEECSLMFPIRVEDMETVKAIDFVMEYNTLKLAFDGYVYGDGINTNEMGMAYNQIENSDILFTSYSKAQQGIENNNTIYYYAKFSILNEDENIFPSDISFKQSFVDGLPSPNTVTGTEISCKMNISNEVSFSIYPNPFDGRFAMELKGYPQDTEFTLFFYDVAGKLIDARRFTDTYYEYENHNLAKGVYLYEMKIGKELVEAGRLISQ